MNARASVSPKLAKRVGVIALVIALVGLGSAWRHLVVAEAAHAHVLVDEAEAALVSGNRGAAVLALERARWLAPRAGFVRSAIDASGVTDVEPVVVRMSRLLTSAEWLAIGSVCGWGCGLGIALLVLRRQRQLKRVVAAFALASGSACAVAAGALVAAAVYPLAVVRGGEGALVIAPYPTAALQRSLPGGALVILGPEFGRFRQAHVAGGATGWVSQPSIETVVLPGG